MKNYNKCPPLAGIFFTTMDKLWSPWRSSYIQSAGDVDNGQCFLCAYAKAEHLTSENLIVYRTDDVLVVMNRYPYNAGHLLIAPLEHVAELNDMTPVTLHHVMDVVNQSVEVLKSTLKPHAFNVGCNLGVDAGAGVPGHLHMHIVPRWRGDTNFMPVLDDVKLISEALENTWEQVRAGFATQNG